MNDMLQSIWRYRHFIISSIKSEIRIRFARSRLGALWMIIHPLAQAAIFALVLGKLMSAKLPGITNIKFSYSIYLLSGMLAWSLFSEVITRCLTLFIDKGNLLKKILFPLICLPLIVAGSSLFNNLLLLISMIVVFGAFGHPLNTYMIWLLFFILITLMLALSIGVILGILNVFVRDIGQIVPIILQLGFWATPIVYTPDVLPPSLRSLLPLNPMATLVHNFQNILLYNRAPDFFNLSYLIGIIFALCFFAFFLFRRAGAEMVDVL